MNINLEINGKYHEWYSQKKYCIEQDEMTNYKGVLLKCIITLQLKKFLKFLQQVKQCITNRLGI